MKKIAISLFIFLLSISTFAQSFEEEYIVNNNEKQKDENTDFQLDKSKINYNFNIGTSFSTWKGGSMLSTYINPNLNYKFTPRFSISTGVVISNNSLFSDNYSLNSEGKSTFVDSYLHFSGIYNVTEKLQVTGSIMYHTNSFEPKMNANAFENLDYSLSAKYKISKNIEVGVQVSKRSYNPYMPYNTTTPYDTNR